MDMKRYTGTHAHRQAGFTLLELLLSIGVLGLLLAGMYGIFNSWTERAINRQAATDMLRLRTAAHDYVLANFDTFSADPPNIFQEIDVDDMKPDNYLPSAYEPINAFRQQMRVFRRNLQVNKIDTAGNAMMDSFGNFIILTTIEVVVVSDNPPGDVVRAGNKRLIDAATAGGPAMGISADLVMPSMTFTNVVASVLNQWSVPRAALAAAGYAATPDTDGGYLATYDLVSSEFSDANDHWLYRVQIDGRPELNRMQTNLDMNANELQNTGTVIADKFLVEGNAAFRGQAQGAAADTAQAMTVEQALRIDTGGDVRLNMKTPTAGCSFSAAVDGGNRVLSGSGCAISGGEIQTVGEAGGDGRMMVANNMVAKGNVITDFTNVQNTTNVAGISTFDTVTGATMNTSTTALAPTTNITGGSIIAEQYQAGNMSVTNGATSNQLVMARAAPGPAFQFSTNQMEVGNGVQLTGRLAAANVTADAPGNSAILYLDNAQAPGGYSDPNMNTPSGAARQIECVAHTNGRTYCEPRGSTYYLGNTVYDNCWGTGTGYMCQYWRNTLYGWQYYGECTFTRSTGNSGQAYHSYSCS
mgnify:CR=1 FL=1